MRAFHIYTWLFLVGKKEKGEEKFFVCIAAEDTSEDWLISFLFLK